MTMDSNDFMNKIEMIEGQIMEEVDGSREYRSCSEKWATKDTAISNQYLTMSKQELEHASKLNGILLDMHSKAEMTDDQKAVIKFLVDLNTRQIRKATA